MFILSWFFAVSLITNLYHIHRKLMEIGHASRTFWERNMAGQVSLNYIEPRRCVTCIHHQPMNSTMRSKSAAWSLHGLNLASEDVGIPVKLLCLSHLQLGQSCWYMLIHPQIASWTVLLLTWLVQIPFLPSLMSNQRVMKVLRYAEMPWTSLDSIQAGLFSLGLCRPFASCHVWRPFHPAEMQTPKKRKEANRSEKI